VDPHDFAKPEMRDNPIFVDQIQMADVLVMNKLDAAVPELVADFQRWADGLFPPKLLIAGTTRGRLDPAWLDLSANDERLPLYPQERQPLPPAPSPQKGGGVSTSDAQSATGASSAESPSLPRGGVGEGFFPPATRYLSPGGPACGWVFGPAAVFDEGRLLALLSNTKQVTRLKGVFHLDDEWASVNRAGTAVSVAPTAYRRDSRLEVFATGLDWDAFERDLFACLVTPNEGTSS
jgi:G3E family GTPase